jgi:hypothetical protein
LPDGIGEAVQVGLFTVVKPLGIKMPSRVSVMFVPVTDSLGETIAENSALYMPRPVMSLMNDIGFYVSEALPRRSGKGGAMLMSRRRTPIRFVNRE